MSLFNTASFNKVPHSKFKYNFTKKISFKGGKLIPVECKEVIPGDKFNFDVQTFIRQMPLVAPTMHQYDCNFAWFFVPYRLIWDEFKDFITGGTDGTLTPEKPYYRLGAYSIASNSAQMENFCKTSSLADYLGFPVTQVQKTVDGTNGTLSPVGLKIDALPFRAYQLIYNFYFRDQNITKEVNISKSSGLQNPNPNNGDYLSLILRNCCWKKDYFTSALPFAQRGPEVTFSLGDTADVKFKQDVQGSNVSLLRDDDGNVVGSMIARGDGSNSGNVDFLNVGNLNGVKDVAIDNANALEVDLSTATATSMNELRRLARLQEWYETKARGGGRYKEQILSFFGVVSDDARLDYPEYLGGGTQPFVVDSISQQSSNVDEPTPLGTLAGKGMSVGNFGIKTKQFKEHGFLMCIAFARPKPSYSQGLPKLFTRFDALDYYWPTFARLGEQEVKRSEIFLEQDMAKNDETFGYQSRYADWKFEPDSVHGQFRTTLNYWHMGRLFKGSTEAYESYSSPVLSTAFVECHPTKRVYAITDQKEDELLMEVRFNVTAQRKMPFHITPKL